jgi:hypothetical protein
MHAILNSCTSEKINEESTGSMKIISLTSIGWILAGNGAMACGAWPESSPPDENKYLIEPYVRSFPFVGICKRCLIILA